MNRDPRPQHPADIRRDYGSLSLEEGDANASPFVQFERWFSDAGVHEHDDPTAMVLATVDEEGHPNARMVLLKGFESGRFIFYTNYNSVKSREMEASPFVSLVFYWPKMARQVRVRGRILRVSEAESNAYFASRPIMSQLSALASNQSEELESRAVLEQRLNALVIEYQDKPITRPPHWGGFAVVPHEMEFWQGRDNRIHDRIHYAQEGNQWISHRLSP